jgi:DinB family protein
MSFRLDEAIPVLERTPGAVRALLSGLPEPWHRANEGPQTWSPFDVVGHLIDGEETDWIPRARIILARGASSRFEPYDRFRHLELNVGRTLAELLDRFAALRAANLDVLRGWGLTSEQLAWEGEHPTLGRVTLAELLATWVAHDMDHVVQIARVMAKRYTAAVGPWREYIRVVRE